MSKSILILKRCFLYFSVINVLLHLIYILFYFNKISAYFNIKIIFKTLPNILLLSLLILIILFNIVFLLKILKKHFIHFVFQLRKLLSSNDIQAQSGASITEFAISFPIVLLTVLVIMQLALIYNAKILLEYAAFTAVRAAIVIIPNKDENRYPEEKENEVIIEPNDSAKLKRVKMAATIPMIPASPSVENYWSYIIQNAPIFLANQLDVETSTNEIISELVGSDYIPWFGYGTKGLTVSGAIDAGDGKPIDLPDKVIRTGKKLVYTSLASAIRLIDPATGEQISNEQGVYTFSQGEDISVEVNYLFFCSIPIAARFAGSEFRDFDDEEKKELVELYKQAPVINLIKLGVPGFYKRLKTSYTLPLETL